MSCFIYYRALLIAVILAPQTALAHAGEDHGDAAPAISLGAGLNPRAEAKSEAFELLIELSGKQLQLYLDGYADNRPVPNARIEVESAGFKGVAVADGDHYRLNAGSLAQPGKHPLVFTITTANDGDLLESTLLVEATKPTASPQAGGNWAWLLAGLAAGLTLGWLIRRKRARKNP